MNSNSHHYSKRSDAICICDSVIGHGYDNRDYSLRYYADCRDDEFWHCLD